jgi:DNA polymerase elongation subunit (family B)
MNLLNKCCVFDIETATVEEHPSPSLDKLRYVGFRLPNGKKLVFHYSQKAAIQNIISMYPILIGHNIKKRKYRHLDMGYDVEVMERHGYKFFTKNNKRTVFVDTQHIIETRAKSMMRLDLGLGQFSLAYLAKYFKLEHKKGNFDYSKLQKERLVGEGLKEMTEYLHADLDTTYDLFKYLYDFFSGFQEFMKPQDVLGMKWLTSSSGSSAYKIICHKAGLPELYNDKATMKNKAYQGGYVAKPKLRYAEGNIYCIDFASLYPHMFIGGNLYSPTKDGWNGGTLYNQGVDAVKGTYSTEQGKIERVLQELYTTRVEVKKQMKTLEKGTEEYKNLDRKQYAIKIVINTMYGISGSPTFTSVYNLTTASDCTAMARRSIKYAREVLKENGYECLYTDTDSVYVLDVSNDYDRLWKICNEITKDQIDSFNIKVPTHDFEIESKIKKIWFFQDDKGEYLKKHYAYLTEDGKLKLKGIKLVKGDCSKLAQEVYQNHIKQHLIASGEDFFLSKGKLLDWIKVAGTANKQLLAKRYRVGSLTAYKNTTSIQAQISMRYGVGEHYLVDNKHIGAGKIKKKARIEELEKSFGKDWINAVDLKPYLQDLSCFIHPRER